jgi:NDP-sugar pyrophosphorylase family protein
VKIAEDDEILRLVEKPELDLRVENWANCGIYVLEKEILSYIPSQSFSDFARDVFPKLIELGLPTYGFKLKPGDYLIDIGTPDKYQKANNDVEAGKIRVRHEE